MDKTHLFSLAGKTAVITGAGKGIGRSIAERFAGQGAMVHILDMDRQAGEDAVQSIQKSGSARTGTVSGTGLDGGAQFHPVNVADQKDVFSVFARIAKSDHKLDILVNNAGIAQVGRLDQTTEEDFDRVMSVNAKGVYNCSLAAVRYMKEFGGGVILNIASVAATLGIAERFAYSASKGAVLTMTYSIAKDYLEAGIRCNAISPARVHTPFVDGYLKENYPGREKEMFEELSQTQPIGRMGQPGEIASLALFLCSDEAGFITGSNYPIDGGYTTLNS
ncbi:MAG: SDR family oxidoreductase [Balneolaceae bacterium]